jgi:hypothetical protein
VIAIITRTADAGEIRASAESTRAWLSPVW